MHDYACEHKLLTREQWMAAKAASQVSVRLTHAMACQMHAALKPDLREVGSKGLALEKDIGDLLKAGDRLEEIEGGHDIFINLLSLPEGLALFFYRPKQTNRLLFWCPLISDETYGEPVLEYEKHCRRYPTRRRWWRRTIQLWCKFQDCA